MANVTAYEIIDHGEDGSQYFPGCGTYGTSFHHVVTGVGDTAAEALDDALESAAQNDERFSAAQETAMRASLSDPHRSAFDHSECDDDHTGDDWAHWISIRFNLEGA